MIVSVGVCTFRRDSLFQTLDSLRDQQIPAGLNVNVIVSDNDDTDVLRQRVEDYAAQITLDVTYIHAPKRNISIARNVCIENAKGDYLLFIDDDEIADKHWITKLLAAADDARAQVVFGPAHAVYPPDAPNWMRENRFHSNLPTTKGEIVETGFSCNTLLDMSDQRVRDQRFDLAYGRTGGEDVDFFFRLHRAGVLMAISDTATVEEPVARPRMTLRWILEKSQATGMIYGTCYMNGDRSKVWGVLNRSALKALYCGIRGAGAALNKTRSAYWVHRAAFHYGVFKSCFSKPNREFYGQE